MHQEKNVDETERQQQTRNKAGGEKKCEPCPRWNNLGLLFEHGTEERNTSRNAGEEKKRLGPGVKSKMKAGFSASSSPARLASQKLTSSQDALREEVFSESSSGSEEEEEQPERRTENDNELRPENWQIHKLVKYLKAANQTGTVLILVAMMDLNLMEETCQLAIRDTGGLEVLLNLLDTGHIRSMVRS